MARVASGVMASADANLRQALEIFRELDDRPYQAWALNDLGMVQQLTEDYPAAAASHQQALDLFGDLGVAPEEARALEGIGTSHLHDGNPGQAVPYLRQALAIYQRIGAPGAQYVQETLQRHALTSATPEPRPTPRSEGHRAHTPSHPRKPSRDEPSAGFTAE